MRFLVVDDSSTMRKVHLRALAALGHADCREARDGQEALRIMETMTPDVIITDWNMPNLDGLELVRIVRRSNATTAILMVTTESSREKVLTAMRAGVTDYLLKPFATEALLEKIRRACEGKG